jgi:Zn-dependent protease with chaperone function
MKKRNFLFNRKRYLMLIISLFIIALGFILMSGGGSGDPSVFKNEIYNFRRIRLAPLLVIIGFISCIVTILYNQKNNA